MDKQNKERWLLKDKRGELTDIMTVGFWLLVIGIGVVFIMFIIFQIVPALKESVIGDDVNADSALDSLNNYGSLAVPATFLIIFLGLLMGVLVSSFFIKTHPIFIPVYILFSIISIIVAVALGNVWGNLKDVEQFQSVLDTNTITTIIDTIMSNMVLVTVVVFILTLIIIFAKPGNQQSQGGTTPF